MYVTGTFDNWAKTEKLDPVGTGFEKTVTLPDSSEKILYKVRTRAREAAIPFQPCFLGASSCRAGKASSALKTDVRGIGHPSTFSCLLDNTLHPNHPG